MSSRTIHKRHNDRPICRPTEQARRFPRVFITAEGWELVTCQHCLSHQQLPSGAPSGHHPSAQVSTALDGTELVTGEVCGLGNG